MVQTLAQGNYVKVVEPIQKLVGLRLLKVTLKCACCQKDMPSFEVLSDRLPEWEDKINNEKNFQPLCKPCAKAHKKWHPEKQQIEKTLAILDKAPKLQAPVKIEDVFIYSEFLEKLRKSLTSCVEVNKQ